MNKIVLELLDEYKEKAKNLTDLELLVVLSKIEALQQVVIREAEEILLCYEQ